VDSSPPRCFPDPCNLILPTADLCRVSPSTGQRARSPGYVNVAGNISDIAGSNALPLPPDQPFPSSSSTSPSHPCPGALSKGPAMPHARRDLTAVNARWQGDHIGGFGAESRNFLRHFLWRVRRACGTRFKPDPCALAGFWLYVVHTLCELAPSCAPPSFASGKDPTLISVSVSTREREKERGGACEFWLCTQQRARSIKPSRTHADPPPHTHRRRLHTRGKFPCTSPPRPPLHTLRLPLCKWRSRAQPGANNMSAPMEGFDSAVIVYTSTEQLGGAPNGNGPKIPSPRTLVPEVAVSASERQHPAEHRFICLGIGTTPECWRG